jgi:type I restriction enzyme M protein
LELIEAEAAAAKAAKEAQAGLDAAVLAQYAELTGVDIKTLVVDDKWFASVSAVIDGEVQRLAQVLAVRIQELGERYTEALPALEQNVGRLSERVSRHLKQMGLVLA